MYSVCHAETASNSNWRDDVDDSLDHWYCVFGISSHQRQFQEPKTQAAVTETQTLSNSHTSTL